jgi:hypothetical protein
MISKDHHWGGVEADPDNYFGFIYIIESRLGRKYIGKKQYFLSANRKQKITDRQSSQWKDELWKESDWKTYTGSSKELNKDIRKYGKEMFLFTILRNCRSKGDLHYAEIEEQVKRNVLKEKSEEGEYIYYNKSIAAIRFRPPDFHSEESKKKMSNAKNGEKHPLFNKVGTENPSFGKKRSDQIKLKFSEQRKGKFVGEDNANYDKTVYKFRNKDGTEEVCTGYELRKKYDISRSGISGLLRGRFKSTYGWFLVKD